MVAAVGRSLGKVRKDGEEEQAGDLLSLPQIHRAREDSHSGKTLCSCQKKKNEMGKGKEPMERWFPVGARMKQKMASGLEM